MKKKFVSSLEMTITFGARMSFEMKKIHFVWTCHSSMIEYLSSMFKGPLSFIA